LVEAAFGNMGKWMCRRGEPTVERVELLLTAKLVPQACMLVVLLQTWTDLGAVGRTLVYLMGYC
jgi:hypothetical protein